MSSLAHSKHPHTFLIEMNGYGHIRVYDATEMEWMTFDLNNPIFINVPLRVDEILVTCKDSHEREAKTGLIGMGFLSKTRTLTSIDSRPLA